MLTKMIWTATAAAALGLGDGPGPLVLVRAMSAEKMSTEAEKGKEKEEAGATLKFLEVRRVVNAGAMTVTENSDLHPQQEMAEVFLERTSRSGIAAKIPPSMIAAKKLERMAPEETEGGLDVDADGHGGGGGGLDEELHQEGAGGEEECHDAGDETCQLIKNRKSKTEEWKDWLRGLIGSLGKMSVLESMAAAKQAIGDIMARYIPLLKKPRWMM